MFLVGDGGGSRPCTQWGTFSQTCPQWEMGEERGSVLCMQRGMLSNTCPQWRMGDMSPVEDGGEEDDLSHVCSGGPSVTKVPMQWEIAEERRILAVYAVEDAQ